MYNQKILNDNDMVTLNVDAYFPKNLTTSYDDLDNKPKINDVILEGNKTTEDLGIDQDFVKDNNYVHTDNNYTNDEKTKLSTLENYDDTEVREGIEANSDRVTRIENYMPNVESRLANLTNTTNQAMSLATGNQSNITALQNDNQSIHESIQNIENAGYQTANDVNDILSSKDFATIAEVNTKIEGIPDASVDTRGLIKVGQNLSIDENGTLNATGGGEQNSKKIDVLDSMPKNNAILDLSNLDAGFYVVDCPYTIANSINIKINATTLNLSLYNTQYMPIYIIIKNKLSDEYIKASEDLVYVIINENYIKNRIYKIYTNYNKNIYSAEYKESGNIVFNNKNVGITGKFIFNTLPTSTKEPSEDTQLVTKKYVDQAIQNAISNIQQ